MKAAVPVAAGPLARALGPRRLATRRAGPGPIHRSVRVVRYKFDSAAPAIRIGGAVKLYVESATSPSRDSRADRSLASAFRHAGVCESRIAGSSTVPERRGIGVMHPTRSRPRLGRFVCDQPPHCQRTRGRIAPPLLVRFRPGGEAVTRTAPPRGRRARGEQERRGRAAVRRPAP